MAVWSWKGCCCCCWVVGGGGSIVMTISPVSGRWNVISRFFSASVRSPSVMVPTRSPGPTSVISVADSVPSTRWFSTSGSVFIMGGAGKCFLGRPVDDPLFSHADFSFHMYLIAPTIFTSMNSTLLPPPNETYFLLSAILNYRF